MNNFYSYILSITSTLNEWNEKLNNLISILSIFLVTAVTLNDRKNIIPKSLFFILIKLVNQIFADLTHKAYGSGSQIIGEGY